MRLTYEHQIPSLPTHLPLGVVSEKGADVVQFLGGRLEQQVVKAVLPLVTVGDDGELERGAVQEDELHLADGVHLLDLVAQFDVLGDRLVKIRDAGVLSPPATKEGRLLHCPDDLVTGEGKKIGLMDT